MTGDAEIISRRGKVKFPFDFAFEVHWRVDLAGSGPCKGVLKFPDVTPDCDGEFEATFEVDRSTPPAARGVLDAFVRSPSEVSECLSWYSGRRVPPPVLLLISPRLVQCTDLHSYFGSRVIVRIVHERECLFPDPISSFDV